jgi:hypothetical protein
MDGLGIAFRWADMLVTNPFIVRCSVCLGFAIWFAFLGEEKGPLYLYYFLRFEISICDLVSILY